MSPRQLLPFTGGLDRASGAEIANPSDFTDLRNTLLLDGSIRQRPGFGAPVDDIGAVDAVCHVSVYKTLARIFLVCYTESTRAVDVWSTDLQGNDQTSIGNWGTLSSDASAPPLFSTAESYGILVLAHDEEDVTARLSTFRYDPDSVGTEFAVIQADLDGLGDEDVKFRWVATHFGYIMAGGFGTDSEVRSDIVRQSSPVDPTIYEAVRYIGVGIRNDPVLGGRSIGGSFVVGKGQSTWAIRGSTSADFGAEVIDPVVGWVNHRAAATQDGLLYFWSSSGLYVTAGGSEIAPAGLELDLPSAYPASLPAPGPLRNVFAVGLPDERHVAFFHPDPEIASMIAYVISLRRAGERRWGLWSSPTMLHGQIVVSGVAVNALDPGYADPVTTTGAQGAAQASIEVVATHNSAIGDETIEVWYEPAAGGWSLLGSEPINTSAATQTFSFTGGVLVPGLYDVQVRYKRPGGKVLTTYVDPDPGVWPAGSFASGDIIVIPSATAIVGVYDPTTGQFSASWGYSDATIDLEMRLHLNWEVPIAVGNAEGVLDFPTLPYSDTIPLAPADVAYGPVTTIGNTLDTAVIATRFLPWVDAATPGFIDQLAICRLWGLKVKVEIRGFIGAVYGAWVPAADWEFIGFDDGFTAFNIWDTTSVSLGTKISVNMGDIAEATGATSVRRMWKSRAQTDPLNGGCSVPLSWDDNYDTLLDTLLATTPVIVTAPACAACSLVPQDTTLNDGYARSRVEKYGYTHWSITTSVPTPGTQACTP